LGAGVAPRPEAGAPSGAEGEKQPDSGRAGSARGGDVAGGAAQQAVPGSIEPGSGVSGVPAQLKSGLEGVPAAFPAASNAAPGDAPPAAFDPSGAPTDLVQPPGGAPIVNLTPDNRDFSADQMFQVVPGPLIGTDGGGISFWVQPQWEAGDQSGATLLSLGTDDAQENRFEIFKDGQSLHFALTDNGGAQVDIGAAIDAWQPGERHLVTATWGQGTDGKNQVFFYVDGQLAGQQASDGRFEVPQGVKLGIGSDYGDGQTVPGVLSNFSMYKRTLTPAELGQAPAAAGK
jgi:hypothetical protein